MYVHTAHNSDCLNKSHRGSWQAIFFWSLLYPAVSQYWIFCILFWMFLGCRKVSFNNTSEAPLQHIQPQSAASAHHSQEARWHWRFQSFSWNLPVRRRSAGTRARQPRNLWVSFLLTRSLPAVSRHCCAKSQRQKCAKKYHTLIRRLFHVGRARLTKIKRDVIFLVFPQKKKKDSLYFRKNSHEKKKKQEGNTKKNEKRGVVKDS